MPAHAAPRLGPRARVGQGLCGELLDLSARKDGCLLHLERPLRRDPRDADSCGARGGSGERRVRKREGRGVSD